MYCDFISSIVQNVCVCVFLFFSCNLSIALLLKLIFSCSRFVHRVHVNFSPLVFFSLLASYITFVLLLFVVITFNVKLCIKKVFNIVLISICFTYTKKHSKIIENKHEHNRITNIFLEISCTKERIAYGDIGAGTRTEEKNETKRNKQHTFIRLKQKEI